MRRATLTILAFLVPACAEPPGAEPVQARRLVAEYVERYFEIFPTAAVEAGRHDFDAVLEDLGSARLADWLAFNPRPSSSCRHPPTTRRPSSARRSSATSVTTST
jgi:hypothetical protein